MHVPPRPSASVRWPATAVDKLVHAWGRARVLPHCFLGVLPRGSDVSRDGPSGPSSASLVGAAPMSASACWLMCSISFIAPISQARCPVPSPSGRGVGVRVRRNRGGSGLDDSAVPSSGASRHLLPRWHVVPAGEGNSQKTMGKDLRPSPCVYQLVPAVAGHRTEADGRGGTCITPRARPLPFRPARQTPPRRARRCPPAPCGRG